MICWGDSQTFGSRLPFGVPEILAQTLTQETELEWVGVNRAVPGETILQLLRRFEDGVVDAALQTVLIGANDARDGTDPAVFAALATQLVRKLKITGIDFVWSKIPPIARVGHLPYSRQQGSWLIERYNGILGAVVPEGRLVTPDVGPDDFVDGVHLASSGIHALARSFTEWVVAQ